MNLQEKVVAYRAAKELSQVQLALQIGCHPPMISNFETTGYASKNVIEKLTKLVEKWKAS